MPELLSDAQKNAILERIGALVKREALRRCPVDTGELRQHINYRIDGDTVILFCDSPIAEYVEFGAGIYHLDRMGKPAPRSEWDIVPVNAKALRFEVGRKARLSAHGANPNIVFAKKVHIKGIHAHPFLRPAIFDNIPLIAETVARGIGGGA